MLTDAQVAAYVDAAAAAQGLAFDTDERARVIAQFARIAGIAAPLLALELPAEVEIAPVFRP